MTSTRMRASVQRVSTVRNGTHREYDIDECADEPCVNRVCEDGVDSFYCNYTDTDFTGDVFRPHRRLRVKPLRKLWAMRGQHKRVFLHVSTRLHWRELRVEHGRLQTEPACHHGGGCVDAVNGFMCECAGTGFEGRVGATETSTNDCADVIRALGDEAEEEDDLEMGEGDDDADVATDAAAPTVDPLQAQKDRNSHQKLRLKTEQENEAAADEPVRVNEFDVYVYMHAVHVHSLFTECVSSSHSLQLRRKTEKAEAAQSPR